MFKRNRDPNSSGENDKNTFSKSSKTARSPPKLVLRVVEDDMGEIQQIKGMMEQLMLEFKKCAQETKELREDLKKREEIWAEEKSSLLGRIEHLEEKMEKIESDKRRYNIVIKGVKLDNPNKVEGVQNYIKEKLGVEARATDINKVYTKTSRFGTEINIIELKNWDKKQEIMKNKAKLKGTKVYIDNDMTIKERAIQAEIRKIAKQEREKGNNTKIGYKKLIINGTQFLWNERKNAIEEGKQFSKN